MRRYLPAVVILVVVASWPPITLAEHAGGTHWAREENPFGLPVYGNLAGELWDKGGSLNAAAEDWNDPGIVSFCVIPGGVTNPRNCVSVNGAVEVCNAKFGRVVGWLAVTRLYLSGVHVTRANTRLNDSYFLGAPYNTDAWRRHTVCRHLGMVLGLGLQDGDPENTNLGTCMDATNDPAGAPEVLLLQDDFDDNSLDGSKWTTNTAIPQGSAFVTETNQRMELVNRGHLNTVDDFDPSALGGIRVTGRWRINDNEDFIQILTRSDGLPSAFFGETTNGIQFQINAPADAFSIVQRDAGVSSTLADGAIWADAGHEFDFEVFDDGFNVSVTFTEVGGASAGTLTTTSALSFGTNKVTFHNRENTFADHVGYLDLVAIYGASSGAEPSNLSPDAHDYEMLEGIYAHADTKTSAGGCVDALAAAALRPPTIEEILAGTEDWGTAVGFDRQGRPVTFVKPLAGGDGEVELEVTHVTWAPGDQSDQPGKRRGVR